MCIYPLKLILPVSLTLFCCFDDGCKQVMMTIEMLSSLNSITVICSVLRALVHSDDSTSHTLFLNYSPLYCLEREVIKQYRNRSSLLCSNKTLLMNTKIGFSYNFHMLQNIIFILNHLIM